MAALPHLSTKSKCVVPLPYLHVVLKKLHKDGALYQSGTPGYIQYKAECEWVLGKPLTGQTCICMN